jgi:hypothetical protein
MVEDKKETIAEKTVDDDAVTWGETKQERIVDRSPRNRSARHTCKGRGCDTAFEKL